jgi:hypothetical protein
VLGCAGIALLLVLEGPAQRLDGLALDAMPAR